jgi:hypothetical protein
VGGGGVSRLTHQKNCGLAICGLILKIADWRFADCTPKKICRLAGNSEMSPRICGFAKYGLKKKIYAPTFPSRTHLGYDSISSMIRNIISFRESVKKTIGVVSFFDV